MRNSRMTRRTLLALFTVALLLGQQSAAPRKIQVLIITGRDDHDWRGATPLMRQYLDTAGIFETRIAEEFRDAGAQSLSRYDVAVLVSTDKLTGDSWSESSKKVLHEFVHGGKGLVVYHHSSTAFKD